MDPENHPMENIAESNDESNNAGEDCCYNTDNDSLMEDERIDEGESSPATSAVSISSVPPNLVSSFVLQQRCDVSSHLFYDLTPITRNTTGSRSDSSGVPEETGQFHSLPSEEPNEEKRQHLSLPTDENTVHRSFPSSGHLPDLRSARAQSFSASFIDVPVLNDSNGSALLPVPLPARNKFFSFTNRQQYKDATNVDIIYTTLNNNDGQLRQYQPSRHEDVMDKLPPEEELIQIFASRSTRITEEKPHRMQEPFLLPGDVPSLHLAHRLSGNTDNASITTHTTLNTLGEEDDDVDQFLDSRHSSWASQPQTLTEEEEHNMEQLHSSSSHELHQHTPHSSDTTSVILEGQISMLLQQQCQLEEELADNDTTMAVYHLREQEALEWLQSLQLVSGIEEAASSKFLCNSASNSPSRKSLALRPMSPMLP